MLREGRAVDEPFARSESSITRLEAGSFAEERAGGADGAPPRAQRASTGGVIGDRTRANQSPDAGEETARPAH